MKILMLAPQPFFEPRGTPFSVLGRLRALSELGHEVDLVTYHIGQDIPVPGVKIHRTMRVPFMRTIKIGPSPKKILLDGILLVKALAMLSRGRYDLLHTHEEASFFGIVLAKLFRIPHLYDMHSSPTEQLGNFKFSAFGPLIRMFDWIEQRVIGSSNAVITICPALEDRVNAIGGNVQQVMIENVASEGDPSNVPQKVRDELMASYPGLSGKRLVLYAGTFESYQGIELLIDSAPAVLREHADAAFLLVGGKPDQVRHYQRRVDELGLSAHFQFTGTRPPGEVPVFISASDVLVSPRIDGTNTPLKIYSYLQSGKPIVATDLKTHTQVLNPDVSVLVNPDAEAFAEGISSVLRDSTLSSRLSASAQRLFEKSYSYRVYIQKTERVLRMAVG